VPIVSGRSVKKTSLMVGSKVGVDAEVVPLGDVADGRCADRAADHVGLGDADVLDGEVTVGFLRCEHGHGSHVLLLKRAPFPGAVVPPEGRVKPTPYDGLR
jgi:hypothetical protein